jgi:predicted phage terminase large subunit-like protein
VTRLSPKYMAPMHLAPLLDVCHRIVAGEQVKVVVHTPPRHGKTETLLHFISWVLRQRPDWTVGYSSYNADITSSKSRVALALAQLAGIPLVATGVEEWRTPHRGGCLAKGIGQGLTGQGLNIGIIDDPVKDRLQAESATYRSRVWDWFTDVFMTRLEPGGSVIVNMARWHPDDLAGRLVTEKGWRYICLPAINEKGEALWPERWPVADLLGKKEVIGAFSFESLFQGQPRPRGGSVFGDPWAYEKLPDGPRRTALGLDFAYTAKTSSDYSTIVVMAVVAGYYYVLDVLRVQTRAPQFIELIRTYRNKYPGAKMRWYAAGTELGAADFIRDPLRDASSSSVRNIAPGLPIEVIAPRGDKFVRAIPYAAAWNAGRILLPEDSTAHRWVNDYILEHTQFTGVEDAHDDQIDAAVAAFDSLEKPAPGYAGSREDNERTSGRRM